MRTWKRFRIPKSNRGIATRVQHRMHRWNHRLDKEAANNSPPSPYSRAHRQPRRSTFDQAGINHRALRREAALITHNTQLRGICIGGKAPLASL